MTATPPDVIDLLSTLIGFESTNFGEGRSLGELEADRWIEGLLAEAGYQPQLLHRQDSPTRTNVVVRVPGADRGLPGIVVQCHLDVVPAEADQWSTPPFTAVVRDGWIHGRGSTDMLDTVAGVLATLLEWADEGVVPRRDVVVAFVADEEDTGAWGAEWLVAEHPELFAGCAASVGEDGAIATDMVRCDGTTARLYPVACAERGTLHMRLTARGASGHGSRPRGDDAVTRLVEALHRITSHRWPLAMSPVVRAQLVQTAAALGIGVDEDDESSIVAALDEMGPAAAALPWTIRASAVPTMVQAGYKVNVIPGEATSHLDVRCPPGAHDEVLATLVDLIGPDVEWEFVAHQMPVESPLESQWFEAIRATVAHFDPIGIVVPQCMGGGTDAKAFSKLGLLTYGFTPVGPDGDRRPTAAHGVDERNSVAGVRTGQKMWRHFLGTV